MPQVQVSEVERTSIGRSARGAVLTVADQAPGAREALVEGEARVAGASGEPQLRLAPVDESAGSARAVAALEMGAVPAPEVVSEDEFAVRRQEVDGGYEVDGKVSILVLA